MEFYTLGSSLPFHGVLSCAVLLIRLLDILNVLCSMERFCTALRDSTPSSKNEHSKCPDAILQLRTTIQTSQGTVFSRVMKLNIVCQTYCIAVKVSPCVHREETQRSAGQYEPCSSWQKGDTSRVVTLEYRIDLRHVPNGTLFL